MAVAPVPLPVPVPRAVDRAERISQAVALCHGGHSTREAADIAGVHYIAVWRALKRLESAEGAWNPDEGADSRLQVKAAVTVELGLERMAREIDSVDPRYLGSWITAAARVGGLERSERAEATDGLLGAILAKLSGGGTVEVAARVTGGRGENAVLGSENDVLGSISPASAPIVPKVGRIAAGEGISGPVRGVSAHIAPTADGLGDIPCDSVQLER